jgi:hypothetical protein
VAYFKLQFLHSAAKKTQNISVTTNDNLYDNLNGHLPHKIRYFVNNSNSSMERKYGECGSGHSRF